MVLSGQAIVRYLVGSVHKVPMEFWLIPAPLRRFIDIDWELLL